MTDQDLILQQLSEKLHMDPNSLRQVISQNNPTALTALLSPQQSKTFQTLLSDKKALNELLNSKQAKELQKKFKL